MLETPLEPRALKGRFESKRFAEDDEYGTTVRDQRASTNVVMWWPLEQLERRWRSPLRPLQRRRPRHGLQPQARWMPGCRRARSTPASVESHRFDLIDVPEETTDTLTEQIRELATANAELKTALAAKKKENNQLVLAQKQTEAAMCNV